MTVLTVTLPLFAALPRPDRSRTRLPLKTEGNYINGVRDGLWTFWYEGEVFQDYGLDRLPNTNDPGEGNGLWDSDTAEGTSELVLVDFDKDSIFDLPIKQMEGSYTNGNKE